MKLFIKYKIGIVLVILSYTTLYAQDRPNYTMYNLYQPMINPAARGSYDKFTAVGLFNTNMLGFAGAPANFFFDVTIPIAKSNAVLGGQVTYDRIGARNRTQISATFAYRIPIDLRNYICLGLTATVQSMGADFNGLNPTDPMGSDPLLTAGTYQLWSPDFRLGAYYFRDNFYAGLSIDNLFSITPQAPEVRVTGNNMHFNLHAGYTFNLSPQFKLQSSILIRQVAASSTQFDINAQMKYKDFFGFGISYRTVNTLVMQFNVRFLKRYTVGYAFKWGLGYDNRASYTGHEFMLMYQIRIPKKEITIQTPHY